ncbi:unnamed protein product [Leptidea sinapis]|uniref:CRAL-TRIO domain-containing protein n=1 Tax=Leptidea sinapis TaxID=189913 RepID=A0A5E4Q3J5_9NEOP|nr:unnamed protein product [Leptidea sinapis]
MASKATTFGIANQRIVSFLRGNKYSLERTKEKIDMIYTLRTLVPELFRNRDPFDPKIQRILAKGVVLPLGKCVSEDGSRPILMSLNNGSCPECTLEDMMKVSYMIFELLIEEDDNFIIDFKDVGISILSQFTAPFAKKVITSFEKAFPVRVKAVHLLNTPPGFETAYTLVRKFLSDKLRNRVFLSRSLEQFNEHFPRELLPQEYGGTNGSIQELTEYWKGKVESYRDWFLAEDEVRSNECLRPEKPKTTCSLFGVEGSFRKLNID